jgi:hypothetical protein
MRASRGSWLLPLVLSLVAWLPIDAHAATIVIVNVDGANEGFNDPTPVAPIGGNPGATIGAQRLYVFQYAANLWGSIRRAPSKSASQPIRSHHEPRTATWRLGSTGAAPTIRASFRERSNRRWPTSWRVATSTARSMT